MKDGFINVLVKLAQSFSDDGATFTLQNGKTPTHAVRAWNNANPTRRISLRELLDANPGVDVRRYIAGKKYNMPSSARMPTPTSRPVPMPTPDSRPVPMPTEERSAYPGRLNNPGNMEYRRNNGWSGQIGRGGSNNRFAHYDTPTSGGTAAIGRWMELARSQNNPTINSIVPIYSPASENNVVEHARNIASNAPGISTNTVLNIDNTGQWVDLARGLFAAESGHPHSRWFTPNEYTNMVNNARIESGRRIQARGRQ